MIPVEILQEYGAIRLHLKKDEVLFIQDHEAYNYFQIEFGSIKMVNYNEDGTEFIQGVFKDGQSFGEPPLFGDFDYPASAVAVEKTSFWKLRKDHFFDLLRDHFEIHLKFSKTLSTRLCYKSIILNELASHNPEHRIITLLNYHKKTHDKEGEQIQVPFTRQEIANMTGLRVETVIRTIKNLEEQEKLKIVDRKIIF